MNNRVLFTIALVISVYNPLVDAQCTLINGTNYTLPSGGDTPQSVAFSPDGMLLATANSDSDDVSLFNVTGSVLSGGVSYGLPSGGDTPVSVTFSPDGMLLATGNVGSSDVSLFTVDCGMSTTTTGGMTTTTGGMSTTTGGVTSSAEDSGATRVESVAGYILLLIGMIEQ